MPLVQNYKLIKKTKLTYNIYELIFKWEKEFDFLNWQFITFIIKWIWWRSYSILKSNKKEITLIIKKREKTEWGRWWSKYLCELNIWDIVSWVWPAWHFTLKQNDKNKLFLWTWTWFVPLFNQINWALKLNLKSKLTLLFGLRTNDDIFYLKKLEKLKSEYSNFDYKIYLSREKNNIFNKWYITDFLTKENINKYGEFYICWAPSMIQNSKRILENCLIDKKNILTEEY